MAIICFHRPLQRKNDQVLHLYVSDEQKELGNDALET